MLIASQYFDFLSVHLTASEVFFKQIETDNSIPIYYQSLYMRALFKNQVTQIVEHGLWFAPRSGIRNQAGVFTSFLIVTYIEI